MTETLANRYSSGSTQREHSSEYQHDRVLMVFKNLCVLVLWTKVASALEGLRQEFWLHCIFQSCVGAMHVSSSMTQKLSILMDLFFSCRLADLLLGGTIMNKIFQPHESHIPYNLQVSPLIQYYYTTVQIINSCTSHPDVCQCLVVQTLMDNMSVKISQAHQWPT